MDTMTHISPDAMPTPLHPHNNVQKWFAISFANHHCHVSVAIRTAGRLHIPVFSGRFLGFSMAETHPTPCASGVSLCRYHPPLTYCSHTSITTLYFNL